MIYFEIAEVQYQKSFVINAVVAQLKKSKLPLYKKTMRYYSVSVYMFGSNVRLRSLVAKPDYVRFSSAQKFRVQVVH